MARRRTRRRKRSYVEPSDSLQSEGSQSFLVMEELSPRARRLVEGGVIDVDLIAGSGPGGRITSGDILYAARIMEVQQSVARIETVGSRLADSEEAPEPVAPPAPESGPPPPVDEAAEADDGGVDDPVPEQESGEDLPTTGQEEVSADESAETGEAVFEEADFGDASPQPASLAEDQADKMDISVESATSTAVNVGGEPIATEPNPWDDYGSSSEGFSERARLGAEQSWGEAEAHLAAMAQEAAAREVDIPPAAEAATAGMSPAVEEVEPLISAEQIPEPDVAAASYDQSIQGEAKMEPQPADSPAMEQAQADSGREVMMDFGTLELVDPESVWAEGAEDFAPWFLAHSRQLGDVLGLESGLRNARQFTTKSATGVLGTDDNGEDVVVVSSQNAVADDSDLGRALGMAASSGAASVALVSAALHEDQLKALAWLNNQTKSGVRWFGIEMRVVRIADSPAAMLFDLVASPPQQ